MGVGNDLTFLPTGGRVLRAVRHLIMLGDALLIGFVFCHMDEDFIREVKVALRDALPEQRDVSFAAWWCA